MRKERARYLKCREFTIRLTEAEYEELSQRAKQEGLPRLLKPVALLRAWRGKKAASELRDLIRKLEAVAMEHKSRIEEINRRKSDE